MRDAHAVGVAGTPTPAFGEEHDGQALALAKLEEPVLLVVVPHSCVPASTV